MTSTIAPVTDPKLRSRLKMKLSEYEERKLGKGKGWELWSPSEAYAHSSTYRDAFYKSEILKTILGNINHVTEQEIAERIVKERPNHFDAFAFSCAFQVIAVYCGSLDEELVGGTGLQPIS